MDNIVDFDKLEHGEVYEYKCECGNIFKKKYNKYKDIFSKTHCRPCCLKHTYNKDPEYLSRRTEKARATLIAKYGSLDEAYAERQKKTEETNLERYGTRTVNTYGSMEFKQNMINKYGTDNISSLQSIQEKKKKTCIERYGFDNCMKNKNIKDKVARTTNERFGVSNVMYLDKYKREVSSANRENASRRMAKSRQTNLKKYGVEYTFQSENNKEKSRKTMLEKYGVECYSQTAEYNSKRRKKYLYDNIYFDSSIEVAYYIYLKEKDVDFEYSPLVKLEYLDKNNKKRFYKPDFIVEGQLVELKGDHLLKNDILYSPYTKELLLEKTECLKNNNVKLIKYSEIVYILEEIKSKYGKDFFKKLEIIK